MDKLTAVGNALQKNGYTVYYADNKNQALNVALSVIGAKSVGIGGSMTVEELGLYPALKNNGNAVYWHWKGDSYKNANSAEVYVCSANAVTEDGKILQTDGNGNRIGALIYGPNEAVLIVGKNKITANAQTGAERIKSVCCPKNARRLKLQTPCALTDECANCRSSSRMCSITVIFERPSKCILKTSVILVNEDLGY